jgi:hypothetical protein
MSGNLYEIIKINPKIKLINVKTKFAVEWENLNKYNKIKPSDIQIIPINKLNLLAFNFMIFHY